MNKTNPLDNINNLQDFYYFIKDKKMQASKWGGRKIEVKSKENNVVSEVKLKDLFKKFEEISKKTKTYDNTEELRTVLTKLRDLQKDYGNMTKSQLFLTKIKQLFGNIGFNERDRDRLLNNNILSLEDTLNENKKKVKSIESDINETYKADINDNKLIYLKNERTKINNTIVDLKNKLLESKIEVLSNNTNYVYEFIDKINNYDKNEKNFDALALFVEKKAKNSFKHELITQEELVPTYEAAFGAIKKEYPKLYKNIVEKIRSYNKNATIKSQFSHCSAALLHKCPDRHL